MRKLMLAGVTAMALAAPAAADAAPASFAGSCGTGNGGKATGTQTPFGPSFTLTANQAQCSGTLTRADGVALVRTNFPATIKAKTDGHVTCTTSVVASPGIGAGSLTFIDVYPAPPGVDPPDEVIEFDVDVQSLHEGALRSLLQGGAAAGYPAGTRATLDGTIAGNPCTGPKPFSGTLQTGPSPSSPGAAAILVDRL